MKPDRGIEVASAEVFFFQANCWDILGVDILGLQLTNVAVPHHAEPTFLYRFQRKFDVVIPITGFLFKELEKSMARSHIPLVIYSPLL